MNDSHTERTRAGEAQSAGNIDVSTILAGEKIHSRREDRRPVVDRSEGGDVQTTAFVLKKTRSYEVTEQLHFGNFHEGIEVRYRVPGRNTFVEVVKGGRSSAAAEESSTKEETGKSTVTKPVPQSSTANVSLERQNKRASTETYNSARKIFVYGLSYSTTLSTLLEVFSEFGHIEQGHIVTNRETGESKGFGFVTYVSAESVRKALAQDTKLIDGRMVHCEIAIERKYRRHPRKPCKDFERGRCIRGENCSFSHNVCRDFQNGRCQFGGNCKFAHMPRSDRQSYNQSDYPYRHKSSMSTLDSRAPEFYPANTPVDSRPHMSVDGSMMTSSCFTAPSSLQHQYASYPATWMHPSNGTRTIPPTLSSRKQRLPIERADSDKREAEAKAKTGAKAKADAKSNAELHVMAEKPAQKTIASSQRTTPASRRKGKWGEDGGSNEDEEDWGAICSEVKKQKAAKSSPVLATNTNANKKKAKKLSVATNSGITSASHCAKNEMQSSSKSSTVARKHVEKDDANGRPWTRNRKVPEAANRYGRAAYSFATFKRVRTLYERKKKLNQLRSFMPSIERMGRETKSSSRDMFLHVMRIATENNDLKLLESAEVWAKRGGDVDIRTLINVPQGKKGHTMLCRAAWAGSSEMIKLLLSWGADPKAKNSYGEDAFACIDGGMQRAISKDPENKIFIEDRYENSRHCIQRAIRQMEIDERKRNQVPSRKKRAFVPSRIRRRRAAAVIQRFARRALLKIRDFRKGTALTPTEKEIRKLRKKLRKIEILKKKIEGTEANEDQKTKLSKEVWLRSRLRELAERNCATFK